MASSTSSSILRSEELLVPRCGRAREDKEECSSIGGEIDLSSLSALLLDNNFLHSIPPYL